MEMIDEDGANIGYTQERYQFVVHCHFSVDFN